MELIIKPTEICNFACTFCSSTNLVDDKKETLSHDKITRFLKRFPQTRTIIVNGGDPLMVPPEYYYKLIDYLNEQNLSTTISLTTNLWDYHLHPEKWLPLFKHPRIGIATSFQYGDARRVTKTRVYTEELFLEVVGKFKKDIGYIPEFLVVIDEVNEDTVLKTVELAKRLGVVCKINYANASGRQSKPYPVSKMYKKYIEIFEAGLAEWEYSTLQMTKALLSRDTTCPLSRECDSHIRCLNPDGKYFSCGAFGDDKEFSIDFDKEMQSEQVSQPLSRSPFLNSLKEDCMSCEAFNICNGCRKSVFDLKRLGKDAIEEHCVEMKSLIPKLKLINKEM